MPSANRKQTKASLDAKKNGTNPYLLLAFALLIALFIVLLILKNNTENVEQKLAKVQQKNTAGQNELPADHPSMEKMERIQAIKDSLKILPNDYHLLVELANNYFDINRFDLAVSNYQKALKQDHKTDIEVVIDLGVAYFNAGNLDSSLYFMNKALKINPKHPLAMLNKGVILFNMGQAEQSIKTWNKLTHLYPNSNEAANAKEFIKQAKLHLKKD